MIEISEDNAELVRSWLETRGGVCLWSSEDLCDPDASWTAPYLDVAGVVNPKPHWKCGMVPKEHVTDASQVKVLRLKVVEVISVGLKLQGRRAVLNNGSDRKVRKALAKYGSDARYHLGDMLFPEVTISVPIDSVLLSEWKVQDVEAHTVGG